MFITQSIFRYLNRLPYKQISQVRNVQISVIGAANEVGQNLGLLLKTNGKISGLNLYDDNEKVFGLTLELNTIPGGPVVEGFSQDQQLPAAIAGSKLITIVSRIPKKYGTSTQQMIIENAPSVQKICRAIATHNPDALFAIATDPVSSMVPFASAMLSMYNCYNPFKVFGITHIDNLRCCSLASKVLGIDPKILSVPVVGGHSAKTIVPLFSNIKPSSYTVSFDQADILTRLIRSAEKDVMINKQGMESATLALAWSIYEFINKMVDAINGQDVIVNTFSTNLLFGTRYFSGPVVVAADGITESVSDYTINDFERELLKNALPIIHEEISKGEEYVDIVKSMGRYCT